MVRRCSGPLVASASTGAAPRETPIAAVAAQSRERTSAVTARMDGDAGGQGARGRRRGDDGREIYFNGTPGERGGTKFARMPGRVL
eukprot:scaffold19515_cov31-Tisochrysis_lutea.AAC.9